MSARRALGAAGLHIIHATGEALKTLDTRAISTSDDAAPSPVAPVTSAEQRRTIRARIEGMVRPSPGTSELLSRSMTQEVVVQGGKDVVMHDVVVGLAPVHLRGGKVDREVRGETLRERLEREGL